MTDEAWPKGDEETPKADCPKAATGVAEGLPADEPKALDCPKADWSNADGFPKADGAWGWPNAEGWPNPVVGFAGWPNAVGWAVWPNALTVLLCPSWLFAPNAVALGAWEVPPKAVAPVGWAAMPKAVVAPVGCEAAAPNAFDVPN